MFFFKYPTEIVWYFKGKEIVEKYFKQNGQNERPCCSVTVCDGAETLSTHSHLNWFPSQDDEAQVQLEVQTQRAAVQQRSRSEQSSASSAPAPSPKPRPSSVCTPNIYITDVVTPTSEISSSSSSSRKSKRKFPDLRCRILTVSQVCTRNLCLSALKDSPTAAAVAVCQSPRLCSLTCFQRPSQVPQQTEERQTPQTVHRQQVRRDTCAQA